MALRDDIFYRPDIPAPSREFVTPFPEIGPEVRKPSWEEQDKPIDPITAMMNRFEDLKQKALILHDRARGLLNLALADIDGYMGDAPTYVLQCLEDLTGVKFASADPTDSIYTLSPEQIQCVFRVAGFYDPQSKGPLKLDHTNLNTQNIKSQIDKVLKNKSYTDAVSYGFKLLLLVIKLVHVVIVHYTVGYPCGFLKDKLKLYILGPIPIGDMLAAVLFAPVEKFLYSLVGYSCESRAERLPNCASPTLWETVDLKRLVCCTTEPFFFKEGPNGKMEFAMSACFERWIREEMFPDSAGRAICSTLHANDTTIEPTAEESAKAKVVSDFILQNPSRIGVMNRSDVSTLSAAIDATKFTTTMASQVTSSLDSSRQYAKTGQTGQFDCFGYSPLDVSMNPSFKKNDEAAANQWTIIERGGYFFEYLKMLDDVLSGALAYADKTVVGSANLAKWGSSRQLCCFVYLLVIISSLIHSMVAKGNICSDLAIDGDFADDLRNEFRWATQLQANADVKKLVAILKLIKEIVDMFVKKMDRAVFLSGLKLPLKDMFEQIKILVTNAIAQFLDILLSPIDQVITGVKGIPEIRHMINNECFGFDKLMDFISCALGSLKFGLIDELAMVFDKFAVSDVALIDDIYLSRTRMAFLKSLSRLMGLMVNLILGLRDCYDPRTVVNEIVNAQVKDQYNEIGKLLALAGADGVKFLDECTVPVMGQTLVPSDDRVAELEGDPTRLSAAFGDLGAVSQRIISSELLRAGTEAGKSQIMVAEFLDERGQLVEPGEFMKRLERITGVRTSEIHESMNYIFDLLRGSNEPV